MVRRKSSHGFVDRRKGHPLVSVAEEVGQGTIKQESREAIDLDDIMIAEAALMDYQTGARSDAPRVGHHHVDVTFVGSRNAMQRKGSSAGQRNGRADSEQRGRSPRRHLQQVGGVHDDTSPRLRKQPAFEPLEDLASP